MNSIQNNKFDKQINEFIEKLMDKQKRYYELKTGLKIKPIDLSDKQSEKIVEQIKSMIDTNKITISDLKVTKKKFFEFNTAFLLTIGYLHKKQQNNNIKITKSLSQNYPPVNNYAISQLYKTKIVLILLFIPCK